MLDKLIQKRTILHAQKEQQVAQLNATLGALALLDEMIAEQAKSASLEAVAPEPAPAPECPPLRKFEPCDICVTPDECADNGCCVDA